MRAAVPTFASTSSLAKAMAPSFANPANLQKNCSLFSKIPQEIRDLIFDLVLTPHNEKHVPYPEELPYRRPGFRHADRNLSTTLLRCCQLTYFETRDLPAKKYVAVDWLCGGINGHGLDDANRFERSLPTASRNLHLFTNGFWLKYYIEWIWAPRTRFIATQAPNLEYLKITFGHSKSYVYAEDDIVPNPKKQGAPCLKYTKDNDPFEKCSWGNQVQVLESLNVMELEIETLEEKMGKLDLVLAKAAGWRFPLAKGKELVFNPRRTRLEGWHGPSLREFCPSILWLNI